MGYLKDPATCTYLSWGPFCLLAERSHSVNGAEIQLLQLSLIKSQSNAPQGDNMVLFPVRRHVPKLQAKKKKIQIRLTITNSILNRHRVNLFNI